MGDTGRLQQQGDERRALGNGYLLEYLTYQENASSGEGYKNGSLLFRVFAAS